MLKAARLPLALALALVGLVGFLLLDSPRSQSEPIDAPHASSVESGPRPGRLEPLPVGTKSAAHSVAGRVELEEAQPPPAEPAEPAEPVGPVGPVGRVSGGVFGLHGNLLSHHFVEFTAGTDLMQGRSYHEYSDERGQYETKPMPVGTYQVSHRSGDISRHVGSLEVRPGMNYYDVHTRGNRSITGAFTVVMPEGVIRRGHSVTLHLELRIESSEELVGESVLRASPRDSREDRVTLDTEEDPAEVARQKRPPGYFRFENLEPVPHVLALTLGTIDETGDELVIEREVDLTDGDVELEPEEFTVRSFLEEAISQN